MTVGRVKASRVIDFTRFADSRGSLSVIEAGKDLDFEVRRVYYMYDMPRFSARGAHGHRDLEQVIIAVHGTFDVDIDDGFDRQRVSLTNPNQGLYVGPMVWRDLINFSEGAVGLVLASYHYDESDYYRDHTEFLHDARRIEKAG